MACRSNRLAAAFVALSLSVANAAPILAQATPAAGASAPAPQTTPAPRHRGPGLSVDARIAYLHKRLQITADQDPKFNAVADAMRTNLQAMEALLQQRDQDTNRTAVSALVWYERMTEAHAAALQKFVPAFEALYTTLSDSQRKAADTIFGRFAERGPHRRASGG